MNYKAHTIFGICMFCFLTAHAQLSKEDSIRLKRMIEGKEEIIINQEAVKSIDFNFAPREELLNRRPMTAIDKPWMKFIRKLPKEFIHEKVKELEITFKPNLQLPAYLSTPLATFDADKLLFETLTKRGRAIRRNRKHATAWKTYNDSVPSTNAPTEGYENKKRIPEDTLGNHFINTK